MNRRNFLAAILAALAAPKTAPDAGDWGTDVINWENNPAFRLHGDMSFSEGILGMHFGPAKTRMVA